MSNEIERLRAEKQVDEALQSNILKRQRAQYFTAQCLRNAGYGEVVSADCDEDIGTANIAVKTAEI